MLGTLLSTDDCFLVLIRLQALTIDTHQAHDYELCGHQLWMDWQWTAQGLQNCDSSIEKLHILIVWHDGVLEESVEGLVCLD